MSIEPTKTMIGRGVQLSRPVQISNLTVDEYLKQRYGKVRSELSARLDMLVKRTEQYISDRKGNVGNSAKDIAKRHTAFLQTMLGILECEIGEALMGWDILLFLAVQNSTTVFNTRNACSFFQHINEDRQVAFVSIMTLVVETANIRDRAKFLNTSPLRDYFVHLQNEKQRTNLAAYYSANI